VLAAQVVRKARNELVTREYRANIQGGPKKHKPLQNNINK